MILHNLYDSHLHWLATGENLLGLDLRGLRSRSDLANIQVQSQFLRGDWLVGFGWNENCFTDLVLTRQCLDQTFPDRPVFFSRVDGHSSWVNTLALQKLQFLHRPLAHWGEQKKFLSFDATGFPSGVLRENVHIEALLQLPDFRPQQKKEFLRTAAHHFNSRGFTHLRDMGTTQEQFLLARELEERKEIHVFAIHNFVCEDRNDLDRAMQEAIACKKHESDLMKVAGLKFYFDGSLGSETAWLSQPYYGKTDGSCGFCTWVASDLEYVIEQTWKNGLDVSVHAIGDEAAHQVVQMARRIYSRGTSGALNLEHVQILRPETIQAMKGVHVTCHMQPCHWLSDRTWLKEKLADLYPQAFPWESVRSAKIPLYFGSDSPIEGASLFDNIKALRESGKAGIRPFSGDGFHFHVCQEWPLAETFTEVSDEQISAVYFQGQKII